jgi:hypothetical protein
VSGILQSSGRPRRCHEGRKVQESPGKTRSCQEGAGPVGKTRDSCKREGRSQSSDVRSFQYCLHLSKDDQEVSLLSGWIRGSGGSGIKRIWDVTVEGVRRCQEASGRFRRSLQGSTRHFRKRQNFSNMSRVVIRGP